MLQMLTTYIKHYAKDDEGATAVEYGIMVALIAAVIIAVVMTLGTQINEAFTTVSSGIGGGGGGGE
jgi:pilus assembly protein Flp/PilA